MQRGQRAFRLEPFGSGCRRRLPLLHCRYDASLRPGSQRLPRVRTSKFIYNSPY